MKQIKLLLHTMYDNRGIVLTPASWAKETGLPLPTTRKLLGELLKEGAIKKSEIPYQKSKPEYYTNEFIIKNYVESLKKQKRKLQCQIADQKYRSKKNDKHE